MRKALPLLVVVVAVLGLFLFNAEKAEAVTITKTRTFNSLYYDGEITRSEYSYTAARNSLTGTIADTGDVFRVGQAVDGYWFVGRSYVFFDTSVLDDDLTVTAANLSLYLYADYSTTDFNVTVQEGVYWNCPHTPLVAGDYFYAYYGGDGGSLDTSLLSGQAYYNITMTNMTWITLDGYTKLALRSSRDIDSQQPSTTEYVYFYSCEKGNTHKPKLYISYEAEGYRYIVYGPYYENGQVFPGIVNVTLYRQNEAPYKFCLNGTAGSAENITIEEDMQPYYFVWNITTGLNETRTFFLTEQTFEEINLYIPDPDEPFFTYTFTVTDFTGVEDGFLETLISVGAGDLQVVERQSIDVVNVIPFYMSWSHSYTLRLVCDLGTHTYGGFTALSEVQQELAILPGMFPFTFEGTQVTVAAKRMNGTWIQVNYTDSQDLTSWVNVLIKHRSGTSYVTDYTENNTANTVQVNWNGAANTTDYLVDVSVLRDQASKSWSFSCASLPSDVNPFDGLLDVLGDWPIDSSNVLGLGIVFAVFGVFSAKTAEVGTVLGVLTAMVLAYIRLLQISWTLLSLALVITFLAILKAHKREEYPTL